MNENDEIKDKTNLKVKIIPREITKNTGTETEALSPSLNPGSSKNINSISNKSDPEQSIDYKNLKSFTMPNNKNKSSYRRLDSSGNPITKNGKQKISFIDKISQNNFVEVIKIESFKAYNKMEEISNYNNMQNNCCLIE